MRESMQAELQARLDERYPGDQAAGYAVGQWGGLLRVSVAEAPPLARSTTATAAPAGIASKKR
jgi:hypothetical protein